MHAEIIFYSANGCGFCVKAKQMLKDQIASGKIMMKDAKEAPKGVRGFPHFVGKNGKTHTGLPPSAEALMQKLGGRKSSTPAVIIPPGKEGGLCKKGGKCEEGLICNQNVCIIPPGKKGGQCRFRTKNNTACDAGLKCVENQCITQSTPTPAYKVGLTTADIVGIVIASVAGVALIVALCFLIAKATKKGKKGRKSRK